MNNNTLFKIAVLMFPLVVISFVFKNGETNFNLEKNLDNNSTNNYAIKILIDDKIKSLSLNDYIIGVVAGEMPASFEIEALKAQAVASRTYAIYKKQKNANNEYDLTNDVSSQVYINKDEMKIKWGSDYQKYYSKISSAVVDTENEIITYGGEIIEALYFSMSSGNTQEAVYAFNESRDYLKSVVSPYDNESLKNYKVVNEFEKTEFIKLLSLACNNITIEEIDKNESGYVNSITICNKEIKGTTFRNNLSLRSSNFDIEISDIIKVTTRGYGHGVGMSQYGANGYASIGYTYEEIIKHYYTGVEINNLKDV